MDSSFRASLCMEVNAMPCLLLIFGSEGDLAQRKLFPALYQLHLRDLLHPRTQIIACSRHPFESEEGYRARLAKRFPADGGVGKTESFLRRVTPFNGDFTDVTSYHLLFDKVFELEQRSGITPENRIFYLALSPDMAVTATRHLQRCGMIAQGSVVFEKPFGHDLKSACKLNDELSRYLREEQIYRIDHYSGKETVQNILMFRFANILFEPVWNRHNIDRVEIRALEELGVEHRAGYFDHAGVVRDMFQNHLILMLSLAAMEIPVRFQGDAVHDEKAKLLRCIRPIPAQETGKYFLRGQYLGYREEPGVAPDSETETFAAAKLYIDNWRWAGVPFYLMSGKRTGVKCTDIRLIFKRVPESIFSPLTAADLAPDQLRLAVQPDEGFYLSLQAKHPGPKLCLGTLEMGFRYSSLLNVSEHMLTAYERLLLDIMLHDRTLFMRRDTVELSWELFTPVLNQWASGDPAGGPLHFYPQGMPGPEALQHFLAQ
ncbi:MAG: glucose-6-phosphate dehydrogenase [Lentisphaeria bacterium]|nr:glucose-6-phosphate dehydrogenase [Lentisphaeria bacterium]